MIIEKDANLLTEPLDGIMHSCNCMHIMGGGIALRIKEKFPEAYKADLETEKGDRTKLGTFSLAILPTNFHIYNMYGQFNIGMGKNTSYDAFDTGLKRIEQHARENGLKKVGLPKNMGCRLGGGSWTVIHAIITDIFINSPLELFICNYDG
jgi:O-acetyl-ADP-ribose deacetylase (regulator of RNase III)